MTDPNAEEQLAPPKPPRRSPGPTSTARSQLEADELYARQLAEHYNTPGRRGQRGDDRSPGRSPRRNRGDDEKDYSFFDGRVISACFELRQLCAPSADRLTLQDDLPVIRDNIRKGFLETQSKVNTWVQNFKKRLDGDDLDDIHGSQGYGGGQSYGTSRRSGDLGRRSGDRDRYDADPQVLGDDFAALELRDSEGTNTTLSNYSARNRKDVASNS